MTTWNFVWRRQSADDMRLTHIEARCAGLEVSHYPTRRVREFDSSDGQRGIFRSVGEVIFHKRDRRWEVRAFADCSAVDLATLIDAGRFLSSFHGTHPGHALRKKMWRHFESARTGRPIAAVRVAYRLNPEDLVGRSTEEAIEVPDTIESLQHLVDQHYRHLLREAEEAC